MAFSPCCAQESREQWFAVQVDPKLALPIITSLDQKGYDAFTPFQTRVRKWRDRTLATLVPAFPGYIFARMDVCLRLPVLTTPGVRGLVGYGRTPIPICDEEIEAVRRVMDSKLPAEPCPFLQSGDPVTVVEGPLAGLTGILIGPSKPNRVLIRVTLIQRALAVDVDPQRLRLCGSPTALDIVPRIGPAREVRSPLLFRAASR